MIIYNSLYLIKQNGFFTLGEDPVLKKPLYNRINSAKYLEKIIEGKHCNH